MGKSVVEIIFYQHRVSFYDAIGGVGDYHVYEVRLATAGTFSVPQCLCGKKSNSDLGKINHGGAEAQRAYTSTAGIGGVEGYGDDAFISFIGILHMIKIHPGNFMLAIPPEITG